ncbi:thiamine pyrophosphate-dependent enzyme [Myxococcota bacterium]|nr:thiamine pyrophosphate-dependent enzyme [Myxococcota bacterium]
MAYLFGGHVVARALAREGVSHLFTLCGGHIQAIYDGCLDHGIRVVDFRHEQAAAHAAEGWARATGQVGVAAVTAGPGVTDAVTAVANARRAQVPMVLIGGQGPIGFKEMGSLQEMDHVELMRSITKWSTTVPETRRLAEYVSMAFRKAATGVPGPVFLEIPLDVLVGGMDEDQVEWPHGNTRTAAVPGGDPQEVEMAAWMLRHAERPVLLVGSQLWWSRYKEGLGELVRATGAPVYTNGMARGALAPDHPQFYRLSRAHALKRADVAVVFGTPLDFRIGYGRPPRLPAETRLIQVDLDPEELGRNRGVDVGIAGDSGLAMRQLAAALGGERDDSGIRAWREELRGIEEARLSAMRAQMDSDAVPVNPLRFAKEVASVVGPDTVVVGDGGDIVATYANVAPVFRMGSWMDPGPLGTLGVGPSYAMASKLADPSRPVMVVYGDGSFGLNGMEFEAAARQGIPIVGVVGNDASWQQIRRGQVSMYGEDRAVATALRHTRYDLMVEALGGHGEYVERPEEIRPALERAFASGVPALVNVKIGASDFRKDSISV